MAMKYEYSKWQQLGGTSKMGMISCLWLYIIQMTPLIMEGHIYFFEHKAEYFGVTLYHKYSQNFETKQHPFPYHKLPLINQK